MRRLLEERAIARRNAWPEGQRLLPAARRVPVPVAPRRIARRLLILMLALLTIAAFAPWRQNLPGDGQVIALSPDERPSPIQATVSGQIVRWHVVEGQRVEAGDVLVELSDNDPDRLVRLESQRDAASSRLEAAEAQEQAYRERLEALQASQRAQITAANAEVDVARQTLAARRQQLAAYEATQATAALQQERIQGLSAQGLASTRDRELAELSATTAAADIASGQAAVQGAQASLSSKRAALARVRASTEADLRSATASLESARTTVASARASLLSAESSLAQQAAQTVTAPRDGMIQRIAAQQGIVQVSRGETLAWLVPQSDARSVALYVDGNDAALITQGRPVRLQFEGWPAVQFAGWPSVAVGSFGGVVRFVDPSDDGRGDFRVVVVPDPDDEPWPSSRFLRQGTRARGWVLLDEVSVGFEVWRQLNGFPPAYHEEPSS